MELEAATTKVTRTATEKRSLLYIIAEITGEGSATEKSAPAAPNKPPSRSTPTAPKKSSKRKWATSKGATTLEEPEHKWTWSIQPKDIVPAGTPPTSPTRLKERSSQLPYHRVHLKTAWGVPQKSSEPLNQSCSNIFINRGVSLANSLPLSLIFFICSASFLCLFIFILICFVLCVLVRTQHLSSLGGLF